MQSSGQVAARADVSTACRVLVVFRNDDPSAASDVDHERRVADVFEQYHVPQTIGVIPATCAPSLYHVIGESTSLRLDTNPKMVDFLIDLAANGHCELALHGYTHRPNRLSMPSRREYTEFRGLPLAAQEEMIGRGVSELVRVLGVRPKTFIPPWNRLDRNTLLACRSNGCNVVSAGPYCPVIDGITPVGMNCDVTSFSRLLERACLSRGWSVLVVCYHSRTVRKSEELAALEQAVRLARTTPDCQIMTVAEAAAAFPDVVRKANDAASSVVAQDEVNGTYRARAVTYRRCLKRLGCQNAIEMAYRTAAEAYASGQYEIPLALTPIIEWCCRGLVRGVRFALAALAAFTLIVGSLVFGPWTPSLSFELAAALAALASIAGTGLWWLATAPETRKETRAATASIISGLVAGAAVSSLVSALP